MSNDNVSQSIFGNCGKQLWKLSCISATIITTLWQLNQYANGPDGTIVEYKTFNDKKIDTYPSVSVCLTNTLKEEKLKTYGNRVNSDSYINFLMGTAWHENFLRIDYDDVTQDLDEYILEYGYKTKDRKMHSIYVKGQSKVSTSELKPGLKQYNFIGQKCFAINFPFMEGQEMKSFYIKLRNDIFKDGKRLDNPGEFLVFENQLWVTPHYPDQFFWSADQAKSRWPIRESHAPKNYVMAFNIQSLDVVQQRNSRNTPCLEGSVDHDTEELQSILRNLGCKPPYWNSSSQIPFCSTRRKFTEAANLGKSLLLGREKFKLKPCRRFDNIVYGYEDLKTVEGWGNSSLMIIFDYSTPHYKELRSVKNMELQTFIGN